MKRTLLLLLVLSFFACKKKSQYCYYLGKEGNKVVYIWEYNEPTTAQIQQVQDTCFCTLQIEEQCFPCKQQTDQGGNDFGNCD